MLTRIRESFGPDTTIDVRGLALVAGSALGIVWGLVRGNQTGWASAEVVASLAERPLVVAGLSLQATGMAWLALIAARPLGGPVDVARRSRRSSTLPIRGVQLEVDDGGAWAGASSSAHPPGAVALSSVVCRAWSAPLHR